MTAQRSLTGGYDFEGGADKEAIKQLNHRKKAQKQAIHKYMENLEEVIKAPDIQEVVEKAALKAIEEKKRTYDAKIIEPLEFKQHEVINSEEPQVEIDLDRMIRNAKARQA